MTTNFAEPHPIDRHVGRRIMLRRKQLKLNQGDLARQLNLSIRGIRGLESGAVPATLSVLYETGNALAVPLSFFLDGLPESLGQRRPPQRARQAGAPVRATRDWDWVGVANQFERITDPRARRKVRELVTALADAITCGG